MEEWPFNKRGWIHGHMEGWPACFHSEWPKMLPDIPWSICLRHAKALITSSGWWFGTFFIFRYIGNNHPNWLSYFSEGFKPPTSPSFSWSKCQRTAKTCAPCAMSSLGSWKFCSNTYVSHNNTTVGLSCQNHVQYSIKDTVKYHQPVLRRVTCECFCVIPIWYTLVVKVHQLRMDNSMVFPTM